MGVAKIGGSSIKKDLYIAKNGGFLYFEDNPNPSFATLVS
jgi:hypothetical protein